MPGKFGKVFQKRKSSGDVLEEVNARPTSTFRVLERPAAENVKSFDEKPAVGMRRKPAIDVRPMSEGRIDDMVDSRPAPNPLNRGSGGTQKSNSSYGAYDSSSGRFSSTSTLPSSVDDEIGGPLRHAKTMSPNMSAGETGGATGFLRTAGRKFSFGGKKSMQAAEALRQEIAPPAMPPARMPDRPLYGGVHDLHLDQGLPAVPPVGRARAPTETSYASESTVTLGRSAAIDKLDFAAEDDDGFGDMFAGIGEERANRSNKKPDVTTPAASLGRPLTENKAYAPYRPASKLPPAPISILPGSGSRVSPHLESATSADGLIVASPLEETDGLFEMGIASPQEPKKPKSPTSPTSPTRQNRPRRQSRAMSRSLLPRADSSNFEDTDALLVSKSISPKASPQTERAPQIYKDVSSSMARASDATANPWSEERPPPVPSHSKSPEIRLPDGAEDNGVDETLLSDANFQALAISADRIQNRAPSPPRVKPAGKVMTPAQFERYRREQAQRRSIGNTSDSDSSKSDAEEEEEEEEEDDIERNKRLAKQRQRQEAQLSVYRQSMMKITGEKPMGPASGNTLQPLPHERNSTRLSNRPSISSLRERADATPEEDDEDDDVPLGILAAHGFPNKELNRPPNHVRTESAAGIQYSSETYPAPPPPQSVAAGPSGSGGNLPAFARKLPQDPFYGAGLVNQPDRQSFALGGGSPGSIYGGSANNSSTHLPPPGGLIGVIASEERARAIRRGTPSKTYGYGQQDPNGSMPLPMQMQSPMTPQYPQQMPQPPPPQPMMGAEQQANIQMAQQMTQMMQMQMQWMQQMMAMQSPGGAGGANVQQMQQMQAMMQQMQGMGGMPGMPGMQGVPGMPGMPGTPGGLQAPGQQQGMMHGRSSTMVNPPNFNAGLSLGGAGAAGMSQGGRAMSMMGGRVPSVMMGGNGLGAGPGPAYTPSIAPSERSNIGQPSRYRPVSTMPGGNGSDPHSRANSLGAQSTLGGFGMGNARTSTMTGRPSTSGGLGGSRSSNMINVRLVETRASARDDEDEEAGWEEMRKKKETKRGNWRLRKQTGAQGKENISPQPSESSLGNNSNKSGRSGGGRGGSPRKSNAPPLPPPHSSRQPHQEETGLEGVFIPDLDRL